MFLGRVSLGSSEYKAGEELMYVILQWFFKIVEIKCLGQSGCRSNFRPNQDKICGVLIALYVPFNLWFFFYRVRSYTVRVLAL